MKTRLFVLGLAFLFTAPALADLSGLQTAVDNITLSPLHNSTVDVTTDMIPDGQDKHWHITASGGSVATIAFELSGFAGQNRFGVYDITNPSNRVQLFGGAAGAGDQATLSITSTKKVYLNHVQVATFGATWFGYYLERPSDVAAGPIWYSDTGLNSDELDHMLAYRGTGDTVKIGDWDAGEWTPSEYLLAWEDLAGRQDLDYDDFVVMVESVQAPVPAAVLLGFLGLGTAGLRLRRFA